MDLLIAMKCLVLGFDLLSIKKKISYISEKALV